MSRFDKFDDPRRRLLIKALTIGLISAGFPGGNVLAQNIFGSRPTRLAPGQSIYRIAGTASVNGTAATLQTQVRPGDTVETGIDSEMIFVVGGHSMIVREETRLVIEGESKESSSLLISALRLLTGKLLSVSRNSPIQVTTSTATIGIRGTGWYAESDPGQTYFCACYGAADVAASDDPNNRETVVSKHHDRPLYILPNATPGAGIRNAPFINHTDQELMLIETLVGRTTPFVFTNESYTGPRRDY